jgi:DNA-directed RNA polymerase specialized sigma24 family protein
LDEAALVGAALAADGVLDQVPGREPSPEMAALVVEQCQRLFGALPDESLRLVALLRLDGYSGEEIAKILDCGLSTVERRLRTIRKVWAEEGCS